MRNDMDSTVSSQSEELINLDLLLEGVKLEEENSRNQLHREQEEITTSRDSLLDQIDIEASKRRQTTKELGAKLRNVRERFTTKIVGFKKEARRERNALKKSLEDELNSLEDLIKDEEGAQIEAENSIEEEKNRINTINSENDSNLKISENVLVEKYVAVEEQEAQLENDKKLLFDEFTKADLALRTAKEEHIKKLNAIEREYDTSLAKLQEVEAKIIQDNISDISRINERKQDIIEKNESSKQKLKDSVSDLQNQHNAVIDAKKNRVDELNSQIVDVDANIVDLQDALEDLSRSREQIRIDTVTMQARYSTELRTKKERIRTLTKLTSAKEQELDDLEMNLGVRELLKEIRGVFKQRLPFSKIKKKGRRDKVTDQQSGDWQ